MCGKKLRSIHLAQKHQGWMFSLVSRKEKFFVRIFFKESQKIIKDELESCLQGTKLEKKSYFSVTLENFFFPFRSTGH